MDDTQLVHAIHGGENELIAVIADRYIGIVYNIIRKRAAAADVDDLVQDVLIAVVRSIHKFKQESSLRTWIHAIVNNKLRYYYRQKKVRSRIADFSSLEGADDESDSVDARVGGGESPADEVGRSDQNALVLAAVESLKEDYREILYLRFTDELSFAEIAQQLDMSLEAAKSRYRRAVEAAKKELRRLGDFEN